MTNLPARHEVDPRATWDTSTIFPSIEAWETAFSEVDQGITGLESFSGSLGRSPARLLEWLNTSEALILKTFHVAQYARLNYAVDATNQQNAAYAGRVTGLVSRLEAATAFEEPELMAVGFDKLRQWVKDTPGLQTYAHSFDLLERRAAHVRSAEVEELLGQVSDPFQHGFAIPRHPGQRRPDLQAGARRRQPQTGGGDARKMRTLLSSPDRTLRRTGWQSYADAHLAYRNTMANCLSAGIKQDAFIASARRYTSSLEAALEGNNLPVSVFPQRDRHLQGQPARLAPLLGPAPAAFLACASCASMIPMPPWARQPLDIPYEQAVDWIGEGMAPLGEEYVAILRRGALEAALGGQRHEQGQALWRLFLRA